MTERGTTGPYILHQINLTPAWQVVGSDLRNDETTYIARGRWPLARCRLWGLLHGFGWLPVRTYDWVHEDGWDLIRAWVHGERVDSKDLRAELDRASMMIAAVIERIQLR